MLRVGFSSRWRGEGGHVRSVAGGAAGASGRRDQFQSAVAADPEHHGHPHKTPHHQFRDGDKGYVKAGVGNPQVQTTSSQAEHIAPVRADLQMVNISLRVLSKPQTSNLSTIFKVLFCPNHTSLRLMATTKRTQLCLGTIRCFLKTHLRAEPGPGLGRACPAVYW